MTSLDNDIARALDSMGFEHCWNGAEYYFTKALKRGQLHSYENDNDGVAVHVEPSFDSDDDLTVSITIGCLNLAKLRQRVVTVVRLVELIEKSCELARESMTSYMYRLAEYQMTKA